MKRSDPQTLLAIAVFQTCYIRSYCWVVGVEVSVNRGGCALWSSRETFCPQGALRSRDTVVWQPRPLLLSTARHSQDSSRDGQGDQDGLKFKMNDDPIPEHLVDMIRDSGDADIHGKVVEDEEDVVKRGKKKASSEEGVYLDVPYGELLTGQTGLNARDIGGLMDSTVLEASQLFGFPIEFFHDTLTRWGVPPPINVNSVISDLVDSEKAFALGEALLGLDPMDVMDNYINDSLEELSDDLDVPLADLFQACAECSINMPLGADTRITTTEYRVLLDSVMTGRKKSQAHRLFDENLLRRRWAGRKVMGSGDLETKTAAAAEVEDLDMEFGGMSLNGIKFTGRLFGEEIFMSGGVSQQEGGVGEEMLAESSYSGEMFMSGGIPPQEEEGADEL